MPLFTLPPLRQIARNALRAHRQNKLQATSTLTPPVSTTDHFDCTYYNPDTRCRCVIGASIPVAVCKQLDQREYSSITELVDVGLVTTEPGQLEHVRYLQQLHDRAIMAHDRRKLLLSTLRKYAAVLVLGLLLPAAAHAQASSGWRMAPDGQITTWGPSGVRSWGPDGSMLVTPNGGYSVAPDGGLTFFNGGQVLVDPTAPGLPEITVPGPVAVPDGAAPDGANF